MGSSREDLDPEQDTAYRRYIILKKKLNAPPRDDPWIWQPRSLLTSWPWRAMSVNARKALDRIMLEHMEHACFENGALVVTHENFIDYGVTSKHVAAAIEELEFLGLAKRTIKGGRRNGSNVASRFRLTWIGDRTGAPATNERKGKTPEAIAAWKVDRTLVKRHRPKAKSRRQGQSRTGQLGGTVPPIRLVRNENAGDAA